MADISIIALPDGSQYNIKDTTARTPMTGATADAAGTSGAVPAPPAGSGDMVLRGDGTWGISKSYSFDVVDSHILKISSQ